MEKSKISPASESENPQSSRTQIFWHSSGCQFQIRKIIGDGNCIFRCMSYVVFGTQRQHQFIRQQVVRHVVQNWRLFSNFNVEENKSSYETRMNSLGCYGSEVELVAFTEVFHTQAVIYFKDSPKQDPMVFGRLGTLCFLLYTGPSDHGHYDALKPIQTLWCDAEKYEKAITRLRIRCTKQFQAELNRSREDLPVEGKVSKKPSIS